MSRTFRNPPGRPRGNRRRYSISLAMDVADALETIQMQDRGEALDAALRRAWGIPVPAAPEPSL